jgi:beta-galactosidase
MFENLTPLFPKEQMRLERDIKGEENITGRIIDIIAPIGRGQRALIVAPPKSGKTVMMQHIAHAITANNPADEVELYLNGTSLGKRSKEGDNMHVMWRVNYEPGTLKAISRKNGKTVLTQEIKTAGAPVSIRLTPDRSTIQADGKDLSFVTVELLDKDGNICPLANQLVKFSIEGDATIAGTDNGDENDHVSLSKPERHLFYGKALAIVKSSEKAGTITLKASIEGLPTQSIQIVKK